MEEVLMNTQMAMLTKDISLMEKGREKAYTLGQIKAITKGIGRGIKCMETPFSFILTDRPLKPFLKMTK